MRTRWRIGIRGHQSKCSLSEMPAVMAENSGNIEYPNWAKRGLSEDHSVHFVVPNAPLLSRSFSSSILFFFSLLSFPKSTLRAKPASQFYKSNPSLHVASYNPPTNFATCHRSPISPFPFNPPFSSSSHTILRFVQ